MNTGIVACMNGTLGAYIAARREALGLNQTELATRATVPRTTVNRIETGTTQLPSPDIRRKLAAVLGVSHLDLLIAAGEITEAEIAPLGVTGAVAPDPVRARLVDRLERVRLTAERVGLLESVFERMLRFDRDAEQAVHEMPGPGDATRAD